MTRKNFIITGFIMICIIAIGGYKFNNFSNTKNKESISTIITVDINPSIKLSVNEDGTVVKAEAMNKDAEEIVIDDLIGLIVDDGIDLIVQRAGAKGFIDINDLVEDFVLITAIDLDVNDEILEFSDKKVDDIINKLQEKSEKSEALKSVNLAVTQANIEQLENAERMSIPVGLYAVNGENQISVKEFFANDGLAQKFLQSGEIISNSFEHQLGLMATYMDELNTSESLKEDLQNAFEMSKEDFFAAKKLYEEAKENYQAAIKSGDKEMILEAEVILERAENFKDMMERYKDSIDSVKEILKKVMEGDESEETLIDELQKEEKRLEEQKREDAKKAKEESKSLEEQKREETKKAKEESKSLEEQKREETKKAKEESKRLEEQKREETKKAKEESKSLEEQKREEIKKAKEESKSLEEQKREEAKKAKEESKNLEEQKREEAEKAKEESKRIKEKK